jgi:hypothetical protein
MVWASVAESGMFYSGCYRYVLCPEDNVTKFHQKKGADPGSGKNSSRIQGLKSTETRNRMSNTDLGILPDPTYQIYR